MAISVWIFLPILLEIILVGILTAVIFCLLVHLFLAPFLHLFFLSNLQYKGNSYFWSITATIMKFKPRLSFRYDLLKNHSVFPYLKVVFIFL